MPSFDYIALDQSGRKAKGLIDADSERHARQLLRDRKLAPVSLAAGKKREDNASGSFFQRGVSVRDLTLFTRQFATLIQSGIPVEEALGVTAKQTNRKSMQRYITGVRNRVMEGHSLAEGLTAYPKVFNAIYCALVASGEKSGDLGEVLAQLADYTEEGHRIRSTINQALAYPATLLTIALAVIGVLMVFVVPKVIAQFEQAGQVLPPLTRFMIASSDFLSAYWLLLIIGIIALITGIRLFMRIDSQREAVHRNILKLPLVGTLFFYVDSARLLRTLGILLAGGVPLVEAIRVATGTLHNLHLQRGMGAVAQQVTEGRSFSVALQEQEQLPPIASYLIGSGERSGELAAMVLRAADNLENDMNSQVQMFISLFEPAVILLLGGVVVLIVLAILLPVLQLNSFVGL